MSEYRDALATAKERVLRLEALAKERGLPHPSHRGRNIAIGSVLVALVSIGVFIGARALRNANAPTEEVVVERSLAAPNAPIPPRDLEWYEPFDSWNPALRVRARLSSRSRRRMCRRVRSRDLEGGVALRAASFRRLRTWPFDGHE